MEAKAKELGHGGELFYMNPNNAHWLHPADAAKVEALGVKDHAVMDIHLGGGGGVEMAENMFNTYPNYTMVRRRCYLPTRRFATAPSRLLPFALKLQGM